MSQTDCHKAAFVRIIFLYLESAVTTFLAYFISCLYIAGSHQMLRTGTSWHLQLLHFKARLALTFLKCVAIHILLISCLEFFISGRNCGEVFKGVQGVLDCQKTPVNCANQCLRELIFPRLSPPRSRVFGQEQLLILFPYLLAYTHFLSSLVSLSVSCSTGNVTTEQWFICTECRLEAISNVLWASLK